MGQNSWTRTAGDLVSATLDNSRQEVVDNIFRRSAYLAKMMIAGRKKSDSGGATIVRSVEYGTNTTVTSFQGFDVVPIVPQETVTDTQWTWKEIAGNWVVSRREERLNTGKSKIRDLADQKKRSLERSFNQKLNEMLLNPASFAAPDNGGKALTPLSELVSLAAHSVGGITESSNSWWANQRLRSIQTGAATQNGSTVNKELRSFYNTCGQNNDGFPNFGIWTKLAAECYESILDTKVRYGSTEMATLGFNTVMLKGMEVAWDQIVPGTSDNGAALVAYNGSPDEECCYFLNTDYLYLIVDSGTDFVFTPPVKHEPNGQYATSGSLLFMGEHICTNRRAQGLYYGFETVGVVLAS